MSGNRIVEAPRLAWMLLPLAVLMAGLLPPPATAQEIAGAAKGDALARLTQLTHDVATLRMLADGRLGPFELRTQCTYCSREFLGICAGRATESRSQAVDFRAPREQIGAALAQAERDAAALARGYAPAAAWIAGLPSFSARFDAAADVVLGIERAIRQGIGPNEQQRRDATQALLALTGELGRGSMQLDAGLHALDVSIEQQGGYRSAVRAALDGAEQAAQSAWRDVEHAPQQRGCSGTSQTSFNTIRGDFSRATQEVAGAFDRLDADTRSGKNALAALLEEVARARAEVESVLRLIAAADDDQLDTFLGRLHLAAAKRQWNELAKAATP